MQKENDLDTTLANLRMAGEVLIPYNSTPKLEDSIKPLKMQTVTVDGYSMLLYFHKVAYEGNFIEVLQVTPTKSIYLPFNVVIKVACKGLGGHNLSFFQFYHHQDNAKIYCWSVLVDSKGRPLPNPFEKQKQEHCVFNGIEYDKLDPKRLDIY
jgi:hypothetical protein